MIVHRKVSCRVSRQDNSLKILESVLIEVGSFNFEVVLFLAGYYSKFLGLGFIIYIMG